MPFPIFTDPFDPINLPVQRCPVSRKDASHRILIMRLGSQGDIVMGTPLLAALRRAHPRSYITWMVEHSSREAVDASPFVDELIVWDGSFWKDMLRERWKNMLNREMWLGATWLRAALKMRRRLRRRRFDVLINFHGEQWPTVTRSVGARTRIGVFEYFATVDGRQPKNENLYTSAFHASDLSAHRTDVHLWPLEPLGLPLPKDKTLTLGFTAQDAAAVDTLLRDCGVVGRFVVVAPMTTWASRNWPEERFVELGDTLARETGCRIIMIGSPSERGVVERIAARMQTNPIRAAGMFGFRGMAALIARASVLVSGDTGPMHVAAAVGTPYVALFGPTPVPGRAPLVGTGVSLMHPVPCGPCDLPVCPNVGEDHLLCMRLITVPEVLAAVAQFLPNPA